MCEIDIGAIIAKSINGLTVMGRYWEDITNLIGYRGSKPQEGGGETHHLGGHQ